MLQSPYFLLSIRLGVGRPGLTQQGGEEAAQAVKDLLLLKATAFSRPECTVLSQWVFSGSGTPLFSVLDAVDGLQSVREAWKEAIHVFFRAPQRYASAAHTPDFTRARNEKKKNQVTIKTIRRY